MAGRAGLRPSLLPMRPRRPKDKHIAPTALQTQHEHAREHQSRLAGIGQQRKAEHRCDSESWTIFRAGDYCREGRPSREIMGWLAKMGAETTRAVPIPRQKVARYTRSAATST